MLLSSLNMHCLVLYLDNIVKDHDLMISDIICLHVTHIDYFLNKNYLTHAYFYDSTFKIHGCVTCYRKNITLQKCIIYTTNFVKEVVSWFQLNNTIFKVANFYATPNAPIKIYFASSLTSLKIVLKMNRLFFPMTSTFRHVANLQWAKKISLLRGEP